MLAELLVGARGTTRALPLDMNATATIELINGEQLATRTDLLLMRARAARGWLSNNKPAFAGDVRFARGSHAKLPTIRVPEAERDPDRTLFIRVRRAGTSTASAAVLATIFAVAIAITTLT